MDLEYLSQKLLISETVLGILVNRGFSTEFIQDYLKPDLKNIGRFNEFPGLSKSGDVLIKGLKENHKIAIWGDYDVDGITASALLSEFLAQKGYGYPYVHFPDRFMDGYGLNERGMQYLIDQGFDLIITVDCGITSTEPVKMAKEAGLSVIVTDHHLPKDGLPDADGIFNPRLQDCYCPDLAGVGVAMFLASYVNKNWGPHVDIRYSLDLVALGTIADMVRLLGSNRTLAKFGMRLIDRGWRPGIAELKKANGMEEAQELNAGQISFRLAPMINAAGRLDDPRKAYDLLVTKDHEHAGQLAQELQKLNKQRQNMEEQIFQESLVQADQQKDDYSIIVHGEKWHQGVIGIVASNLVENYNRPVLILTRDNDGNLSGSGRSISDLDLHKALTECEKCLVSFGGHKMAAGLTVKEENISMLKESFEKAVQNQIGTEIPIPEPKIDSIINPDQITPELVDSLEMLEPFGIGNPKPVFLLKNMELSNYRLFGKKEDHLMLYISHDGGQTLKGKAWRMATSYDLEDIKTIDVICCPEYNIWNGIKNIELNIKKIKCDKQEF